MELESTRDVEVRAIWKQGGRDESQSVWTDEY